MKMQIKNSPNHNARKILNAPYMLILHYTGTQTAVEADEIYMTPDKVSAHYMLDRDGSITKYIDEDRRAWHAGQSSWAGISDINSASIGIEIVNRGHEFGLEDFPDAQIGALIELIRDIRSRWVIPNYLILGHSDVAPGRKIDPGEKFPWAKLHAAGIGLMPDPALAGNIADDARELTAILRQYGYDYTDDDAAIIDEFRRHYLYDSYGNDIVYENLRMAAISLLNQKNSG